jgi:glycosyltransferase involved in cell wall biosynthesis
MIAGALLGKRVEFAAGSYHKVAGIADHALAGYPVTPLAAAARPAPVGTRESRTADARVSVVVLSHGWPELALRAIDSLRANKVSFDTVVIDNNSPESDAVTLAEGCARRDGVRLRRLDRNLGCAGGRQFALGMIDAEYVLFLDDDAELDPGALDLLVAELDADSGCGAVAAGCGELIRHELLDEFPLDPEMSPGCEMQEWRHRVELARPGSVRAMHPVTPKLRPGVDLYTRSIAVEALLAHAHFYRRHGVLLAGVFELVPELSDARDEQAARLLMELLLARGTDWTLMEWMNGNLEGLLASGWRLAALERELSEQRELLAYLHERHTTLERIEAGGFWRLRRRLLPILRAYWRIAGRAQA